jgi:predicted N-acyltransferase
MLTLNICHSLASVLRTEWDALVDPDFPFADYDHLFALESTGCAGPEMGWLPIYLLLRDESDCLVAASYGYLKSHGYGEFIFDNVLHQAYSRAGKDYYPKLVMAVPYTPATGPKVLVRSEEQRAVLESTLAEEWKKIAVKSGCSSVHALFIPLRDVPHYSNQDYLLRHSYQYHWFNRGYHDFEQFLSVLKTKRRRQIQMERRSLHSTEGLQIVTKTGQDLTEADADLIANLYLDTNEKWGSIPCLSRDFFRAIFSSMSDRIVLFVALVEGKAVAAAINFVKGRKMFGRYWGTTREIKFLHFELCYYQAIDYCIQSGLEIYEAGAQGEHKIPRGFIPQLTYSCHCIMDPMFQRQFERFLEQEKKLIDDQFKEWAPHLPYA